jgi:hypothetical protein
MPANRRTTLLALSCFAAAFVAAALGCGGPARLELHPATGRVQQNGKPAAGARVTLHPAASIIDEQAKALRPSGVADASGAYSLSTYVPDDGAPAGEWTVTVVWPDPKIDEKRRLEIESDGNSVPDILQGRFAKPESSPWKATIAAGANTLPTIDLAKP